MTRAENVKSALNHGSHSWTDLLVEADKIAEAYDQDWDNEITWFEYADGSVAAFHGLTKEIHTFASKN